MEKKIRELGSNLQPKDRFNLQRERLMTVARRKFIHSESVNENDNIECWVNKELYRIINEYLVSIDVDKKHLI